MFDAAVHSGTDRALYEPPGRSYGGPTMRCGIIVAALIALSATGAQAEDWCGYVAKENAVIECGYSTVADCESAIGKGAMCFINPDYALNVKRVTPNSRHPEVAPD
jgi:hypothetical protein